MAVPTTIRPKHTFNVLIANNKKGCGPNLNPSELYLLSAVADEGYRSLPITVSRKRVTLSPSCSLWHAHYQSSDKIVFLTASNQSENEWQPVTVAHGTERRGHYCAPSIAKPWSPWTSPSDQRSHVVSGYGRKVRWQTSHLRTPGSRANGKRVEPSDRRVCS